VPVARQKALAQFKLIFGHAHNFVDEGVGGVTVADGLEMLTFF